MAESSRKSTRGNPSKLVPGAGAGKQPGAGRPPNLVRELARGAYSARLPILEQIADGKIPNATPRDRIAALKELREVGFPQQHEHTGADGSPILHEVRRVVIDPKGAK